MNKLYAWLLSIIYTSESVIISRLAQYLPSLIFLLGVLLIVLGHSPQSSDGRCEFGHLSFNIYSAKRFENSTIDMETPCLLHLTSGLMVKIKFQPSIFSGSHDIRYF